MTITEYEEKKHIENVRKEGLAEGLEEGRTKELVSLVKDKLLTAEIAATRLGMSLSEFDKLLNESDK